MQIVDTRPPQAKQENRIFRAIGCTAVYLTSVGALCSMAGLGRTLLGAWGAGTVLLLALCFLPEQAKIQNIVRLSLFLLLGAAVWVLLESVRDGVCLFLNRLFAASELQQAYLYEKLPVRAPQAEQTGCVSVLFPDSGALPEIAETGRVRVHAFRADALRAGTLHFEL